MQMTLTEAEALLKIDPDALDEALINQPMFFYQVGHQHAMAISIRDAAKQDLDKTDADLGLIVRHHLEEAGGKVTESLVASKVLLHERHTAAVEAYLTAKNNAEVWGAAKDATMQRSYVLKDLAALYVAGYYGATDAVNASERQRALAGDAKSMEERQNTVLRKKIRNAANQKE